MSPQVAVTTNRMRLLLTVTGISALALLAPLPAGPGKMPDIHHARQPALTAASPASTFSIQPHTANNLLLALPQGPVFPATLPGSAGHYVPSAALMKAAHAWQVNAEQAFIAQHHLKVALHAVEEAQVEREALQQEVQVLAGQIEVLERQNAALEAEATASAVIQPPPLVDTTPPPLPTPTVTSAPAAQAEVAPDPTPALVALVANNLAARPVAELRDEAEHAVTSDTPSRLELQSAHGNVTHHLDGYSGSLLETSINLHAESAEDLPRALQDILEGRFGPAAVVEGEVATYFGPGVDVTLTQVSEHAANVRVQHTGLGVGPIQVFDAPPKPEVEPQPLVTRYD